MIITKKDTYKRSRKSRKKSKNDLKSNIRAATSVISSVALLQRLGLQANIKSIKQCILQKCRKPARQLLPIVPFYLNRAWQLGILKKTSTGAYKLENFEIKKPRRKKIKLALKKREEIVSEQDLESQQRHEPVCTTQSVNAVYSE